MRMMRSPLTYAVMASALAFCSPVAAQETATEGVFHGRGIVKAVEPGTGAVTLAHDDINGLKPAMEMKYRVQTYELSECLRPGDTVDFSIDASDFSNDAVEEVIVGVNLLNYDE
jgi:Cu/Ag efflux protein CusF